MYGTYTTYALYSNTPPQCNVCGGLRKAPKKCDDV